MSRRPTLRDVAAAAGVSIKTVSRVVNDDPKVAVTTRQRVQDAISRLNYEPDLAARTLRSGRDATVGLIMDSFADPFFAALGGAAEEVFYEQGYTVLVASHGQDPKREHEVMLKMLQRRVSGLLVAPTSEASLSWMPTTDLAIAFVDRTADYPGSRSVVVDDQLNARLATEHLIAHGHRRIALLSDRPEIQTSRLRTAGFRDAMASAGLDIDERLVRQDCLDSADARRVTGELLESGSPPTAILSSNTRCSIGMVGAIHATGRMDVAHVSYGDFDMAEALTPAVTVVDHDGRRLGREAALVLMDALPDKNGDRGDDPAGTAAESSLPGGAASSSVVYVPAAIVARGSGELPPC